MAGKPVPVVRDVYGFGTKRAKVSLTWGWVVSSRDAWAMTKEATFRRPI